MPFQIGNGNNPAAGSSRPAAASGSQIARPAASPEVTVWKKIEAFFCSWNEREALECLRQIYHPPAGTTREAVAGRFEQLRAFAYAGFKENVQSGRYGENHFCILDENSREMLSVTLDDAGKYTVKCEGHRETYNLTPDTERAEHAAATTAPQTAPDYEAVWSAWERAAPREEAAGRAAVVQELRSINMFNRGTLRLYNLNISSLPDALPPSINEIRIISVPLTSLPALPHGLTTLEVERTPLTSLPALPHGLTTLLVSHTPLTSPLTLPHGLTMLWVENIPLTSLPALPHGLTSLDVKHTPLTSLPELPNSLTWLAVNNTSITSLPESITGLFPNASVYIDSPLSERTRRALEAMTSAPDYSGPRIHFSMAGPSVPREPRPLHLAVADWLTSAKEGEPAPADRWRVFGRENDAASFSAFLDRLGETENFKKDPGFKAQIASWLTQLAGDDALREKTFVMATEAASSCEDRVTLALNQMKNVQLVHDAEKGRYDKALPELVAAGREMFRLEQLGKTAQDKVSTLLFVDEIEVYLGYQNKLKQQLGLASVTAEMRFFDVSHITDSDLQAAELQVKAAENQEFGEWILQWAPLRSVLERTEPERWEALCEKKESDYNNTYSGLKEGLKKARLDGDTDAERAIGTSALERAEQAFLDGLRPLTNEMLGGYLKAPWP